MHDVRKTPLSHVHEDGPIYPPKNPNYRHLFRVYIFYYTMKSAKASFFTSENALFVCHRSVPFPIYPLTADSNSENDAIA